MFKVILVLGKRLVNNQLTQEGLSRVEALPNILETSDKTALALVFCGGITINQSVSEASAMYKRFLEIMPEHGLSEKQILLEELSINTVENISNAADKLIQSSICTAGQAVECVFVSNDYHLERIFEIQALMDEQGLLRVLKDKCMASGLSISISNQLGDHCVVPYPHQGASAEAFLAVDELTTYRVYLEGIKSGVFQRPHTDVRREPLALARMAIKKLSKLNLASDVRQLLDEIENIVESTTPDLAIDELLARLKKLDGVLTYLNRYFDPEQLSYK